MVAQVLLSRELVTRRIRVKRSDVVFVKGIFEASEGVGVMFAEQRDDETGAKGARAGTLLLAAPISRAGEFEQVVTDVVAELGAELIE